MIKIVSMSTNLGSAICQVEFLDIDNSGPLQTVRGHHFVDLEGRYIDASDPELMSKLDQLLTPATEVQQ